MTSIECRLQGGVICEVHCRSCRHFDGLTWHCLYYERMVRPVEELAEELRREQELKRRLEELHDLWLD